MLGGHDNVMKKIMFFTRGCQKSEWIFIQGVRETFHYSTNVFIQTAKVVCILAKYFGNERNGILSESLKTN